MQNANRTTKLLILWNKWNNGGHKKINNAEDEDLAEIKFSEKDISNAIENLKKNSAAGPDGIPAIFLINTREYIKAPLALILRKSLDEGTLPDVLKLAYVTQIQKGGV